MRIAVGQLWQETNTFNRQPTGWADFENWGLAEGDRILAEYGETGEIGGFVEACRLWRDDIEFLGLARFACWPWGAIDGRTWERIRERFAERLSTAGSLDAVFLALHGAMAADGEPDVTGALLEQVRRHIGPDVPIVGTLDLHANITRRMVEAADVLAGYHACPHLDSFETGGRAAAALRRMVDEHVRPVTTWRKLPMITPAEHHDTFTGPPAPLYRRIERIEAEPHVLTAGLYMAMPWFDVPDLGWAVTVTEEAVGRGQTAVGSRTSSESPGVRRSEIEELARDCWDLRETMTDVERFPPEEVVERALAILGNHASEGAGQGHGQGDGIDPRSPAEELSTLDSRRPTHPVVIGDAADATNSGSPGDATALLQAFLNRDSIPHGALTFLVDPESVALAERVGVGGTFERHVGAGFAPEYSEPVLFRGTVERCLDVEFVLDGHISRNLPIRMGRGAVVRSGDVTVLFTERSGPGSTPRLYETAGLDPRAFGIVVAKSPAGFRADYGPFAAEILLVDGPGCAAPNLARLNFRHVDRPLWPPDAIADPHDAAWCRSPRRTEARGG